MKRFLILAACALLMAGCGKKGDSQTSDQQIMKLESEIQILQQSVEIQSKTIKVLQTEVAQLKNQLPENGADSKVIESLKTRIEMLEDGGFAK